MCSCLRCVTGFYKPYEAPVVAEFSEVVGVSDVSDVFEVSDVSDVF